jgi:peroxiredoxin
VARWRFWYILAFAAAPAAAGAGLALRASCSSDAETVATIQASDPLQIRYSMGGESQVCYAVSVSRDGNVVQGFLLGTAHPAIAEFEREARTHVPEIPPAPAPPPAAAQVSAPAAVPAANVEPVPQGPVSMAGFRAVDWKGNRVDLSAMHAPNVVVYFWSTSDRSVARKVDAMENVYDTYRPRGVEVIGVVSGTNRVKFEEFAQRNEMSGPQILDSGQIATRYHVSPAKPFLVLDQQRNVIAAVSSTAELEAILDPLAGRRRIVNP